MNKEANSQDLQDLRQRKRIRYQDKVIVITGASKGIGRQVAVDYSKNGVKGLAIVARNRDQLNRLALKIQDQCECLLCPCDVSDKSAVLAMARNVLNKFGKIDILVNNAGFGILGKVVTQTIEEIESVTATNYLGMVYCTKAFLGSMIERKSGHIVNVASLAASFGIPGLASYCGSKFAMLGFSESLSHEIRGTGVGITVVSPIAVKTNFFDHPSFQQRRRWSMRYSMDARTVSKAVIRASASPRFEIVVPFFMRGAVWLKHTIPYVVNPIVGSSFRKVMQLDNDTPQNNSMKM
jgi:short-subunit dehydrogenase